jgi:hypothetical protein
METGISYFLQSHGNNKTMVSQSRITYHTHTDLTPRHIATVTLFATPNIKDAQMKVIQGGLRMAFLFFFTSHIPISILIDGQGALASSYPRILTDVVRCYTDCFGDVLMRRAPSLDTIWFSSFIFCELLFQLPFFFMAIMILLKYPSHPLRMTHLPKLNVLSTEVSSSSLSKQETYPNWFRTMCLIYGSHVCTTLVPIVVTFMSSEDMSSVQKAMTISSTYKYDRNHYKYICDM